MSVRGAVDLGALAAAREAQAKAEQRRAAVPAGEAPPLSIDVTEETFQADVIEASFVVPVVIDLWATWCGPCTQLSPILERLVEEYAGQWVLAKIDVDANPRIAQAFQVQSIPSVLAVVQGQPVPLFQGALPEAGVRQYLDQLLAAAAAAGMGPAPAVPVDPEGAQEAEEAEGDPRFDAAFDAVEAGDWEAAEAAYRAILAETPDDEQARLALGQVALMRRTEGVDPVTAVSAADAAPDDVAAQTVAADVQLLTGEVDAAFARLLDLVRRTSGDERAAAREHLVGLFQLVGDADPRVPKARTALANALF